MIDINKLNRVKGILSARLGAEIPKHQTGAKFAKQKGSTIIYSSDYNTWFSDPNLTLLYFGDIRPFQDISTQNIRTTSIPGGNPNEGKPYISLEKNAELLERTADVTTQTLATELSKTSYMLPKLTFVASKNNPTELNLPKTIEITPELQASLDAMLKTAGMNLERLRLEQESAKNARAGQMAQFATDVFTSIGDVFGAALQATDSDLTKGITTGYKAILSIASNFGPIGQAVSSAMGVASAAGDFIQALGGGTDLMTTTDLIMDSPLFSWNVGAVNGFLGEKSNSFGVDYDTLEASGSSYGGASYDIQEAKNKSNKKYGLFSSGSRRSANRAIARANATLNQLRDIVDSSIDQRLAVLSMGELAGLNYSMLVNGGYDLKYTYAAKHGGLLEWNPVIILEWEPLVELNWELPEFKEGGNIDINNELEWIPELQKEERYPKEYLKFKASLPDNQKNTPESDYDTYLGWKLYGKPKDFETAKELGMYTWDSSDNSWHGNTIAWDETTDIGYFLKPKHHSTIGYELDWFNKGIVTEEGGKQREMTTEERKEWEDFKNNYTLIDEGDFYKYIPKNKKGGSVGNSDVIEIETNLKNVIPEGALHKNKHHMEHAEGLTKKGIPVIDDDGELLAEIEHSEIIFTLEVTKKLEEYYDIFYSEESSNVEKEQAALDAGKLLVYQILENTEDRTGLIESCKKGGTLTLKKSTDDLILEVVEETPVLVVVEDVIKVSEEDSKKESEKSEAESTKEIMKEAIKEVLIELLIK